MMDNDKSNDLLIDIAQRLSNIEGKLEKLDNIDYTIDAIRDTSNQALSKAHSAHNYALENEKNINKLAELLKWTIGLAIPTILTIIGLIITLFVG